MLLATSSVIGVRPSTLLLLSLLKFIKNTQTFQLSTVLTLNFGLPKLRWFTQIKVSGTKKVRSCYVQKDPPPFPSGKGVGKVLDV